MKYRKQKGFTLAELLIVVAIIAVLVAVAIPIFSNQLEKARQAVDMQNARAVQTALVNAYNTGEIDLSGSKQGDGIWVLFCRNRDSAPSGYNTTDYPLKDGVLFCGADAGTTIKNEKLAKGGYSTEVEAIIKEYGVNTDSLKIKCSANAKNGWDWIVVQMVYDKGIVKTCMYSGFKGKTSAYDSTYGSYDRKEDNLGKRISGN